MSGSGGGSFGGSPIGAPECKDLSFITNLASPNPGVLGKLKIGDILDIVLQPPTGPILAMTNTGETAGAILISSISQLINCLNDGHEFQGKVQSLNGGDCQIIITSK